MRNLSEIQYRNEFVSNFDGDDSGNITPRQTPRMLYSKALPTPVNKVSLLAWSDDLANELEIDKPISQDDINILGGNLLHLLWSLMLHAMPVINW